MGRTIAEFTMSLDGFIAGPKHEVGPLFGWYASGDTSFAIANTTMTFKVSATSAALLRENWGQIGAIVTGRRDFDVSEAWGGVSLLGVPMFIVTHHPPPEWLKADSPFTFVTEGVEHAVALAQQVTGDKVVSIGGTTIVQQCLQMGLLDEIHIHLASILLGTGIRLFDQQTITPLEIQRVLEGTGVTHLQYRVVKPNA